MTASVENEALSSVDHENFDQLVLRSSVPVLVDFSAGWCGPCKSLIPILEAITQDPSYKDRVKIVKLDVDQSPSIAQQYKIRSIPVIILFKDGRAVQSLFGLKSEQEIRKFLDDHL